MTATLTKEKGMYKRSCLFLEWNFIGKMKEVEDNARLATDTLEEGGFLDGIHHSVDGDERRRRPRVDMRSVAGVYISPSLNRIRMSRREREREKKGKEKWN